MNTLELYLDQENMHSFEGRRGVQRFEKVIAVLGYPSMDAFLEDNSGALEAMLGFVHDWTARNSEWDAALTAQLTTDDIVPNTFV